MAELANLKFLVDWLKTLSVSEKYFTEVLKYSTRFSSNKNHDANEASLVVGEVTSGGGSVRDVGGILVGTSQSQLSLNFNLYCLVPKT